MTDAIRALLERVKELGGKLIENAASAIYEVRDDPYDLEEWGDLDSAERERYECDARAALEAVTPSTLTLARALEAVLEVHKKVPVYEWCAFNLPPADECHLGDDEHIELANGDWGHVNVIEAWTCNECHHDTDDEIPDWPCPTVRAITEHLGGET